MKSKGQLLENKRKTATRSCCEALAQAEQSGSNKLEGPFMRGFKSMVDHLIGHDNFSWQSQTARHLQSIDSYEAFLKLLNDGDPNIRIFAVDVIGRCGYQLSEQGQTHIRLKVHNLLRDNAANDYVYGGFQGEDESLFTVAKTAQAALISLACAASSQESSKNEP